MINTNQQSKQLQQQLIRQQASNTDAYSFFNLLTNPQLISVVEEQLPEHRERLYPPTTTLSLFLSQCMNTDSSCQNTVNAHVIERVFNGLSSCSTQTGAYCKARQRLPLEMIASLVKLTGRMVHQQVQAAWQWQGRPVKLVDGTTITMPDTPENQHVYPQPRAQQLGIGFPIARMVAVICLSSGMVLNAAMGPAQGRGAGEHALLRQLLDSFEPGDIVLADRYYCSYFLICQLLEKGIDVVFQQHAVRKTDFRKGVQLSARDHIVAWKKPKVRPNWMTQAQYESFSESIILRETKVNNKVIVTSLLNDKQASKQSLGHLYKQRWHVELDLRNIKTTLGMEALSCKTPEMNEKEMWVYFLAYNLIRLIMAEAAIQTGIQPREISFKHSLQLWLIWSRQTRKHNDTHILFILISQQRVGNRPGRVEPRAVKRRPKPFSLLMQPRDKLKSGRMEYGHNRKLK